MPSAGDVIQMVHEQDIGAQTVLNVYYFQAVDATADLGDLANWFNTNVVPDIKALQSPSVTHVELELVNLFDDNEFLALPLSGAGTNPGAAGRLSTFTAAQIRLLHGTGGLRTGFKRYIAGTEDDQQGDVWTAAFQAIIDDVGDDLMNPLTPALATWTHVIVKRIKFVDPVSGEEKYRLPENIGELVVGYPTSFFTYPEITTQNSRKWYTD